MGGGASTGRAGGSIDIEDLGAAVAGKQLYIWVYNSKDVSSASAEWLVITASNDSGVTSNSNWLGMASTDTTSYEFDIHTANPSIYGALSGAAFDTSESIGHGTAAAPQLVDDGYVFKLISFLFQNRSQ